MKNWINRIFRKNQSKPSAEKAAGTPGMPDIPPSRVQAMIQMVANTQENEISCDEAHRFLDQFAEMALRGENTASLLPLVNHHLETCPDCREEYDALMRILQAS